MPRQDASFSTASAAGSPEPATTARLPVSTSDLSPEAAGRLRRQALAGMFDLMAGMTGGSSGDKVLASRLRAI